MTTLRFPIMLIAIAILAMPLAAQMPASAPANPLSTSAKAAYMQVQGYILRSAEKMPEADYAFAPTPEVRTFGRLIGHVADAQNMFCSLAKGEARPEVRVEKTKTTKAELIEALKASNALCDSAFEGLTNAKAAGMVKMFGSERPLLSVLWMNTSHDNEHYGNIVTYMRLKGLVPASSEPRK
jgi:uncharacterized damage-inducible protein DinB